MSIIAKVIQALGMPPETANGLEHLARHNNTTTINYLAKIIETNIKGYEMAKGITLDRTEITGAGDIKMKNILGLITEVETIKNNLGTL